MNETITNECNINTVIKSTVSLRQRLLVCSWYSVRFREPRKHDRYCYCNCDVSVILCKDRYKQIAVCNFMCSIESIVLLSRYFSKDRGVGHVNYWANITR